MLCRAEAPALSLFLRVFQRGPGAGEPLSDIDVAEGAAFQRPRRVARLLRAAPEQRQRMFEQGHQLGRGEVLLESAQHEIEEGARHGARDRNAGRIVDRQIVTLEPRRHAPRQHAVGRDQRRGLARRFDAGSQDQGDGLGLLMRVGRHHETHAGKRIGDARAPFGRQLLRGEEFLPMLRALGGTQRFAGEIEPRAGGGIGFAPRHGGDLVAPHAEPAQQLGHAGLRMLGMLGQRGPALLVERFVEPRQHHRAVRQRGDDLQAAAPLPARCRSIPPRSRDGANHGRAFRPPSPSTGCVARRARRGACPRDISANAR